MERLASPASGCLGRTVERKFFKLELQSVHLIGSFPCLNSNWIPTATRLTLLGNDEHLVRMHLLSNGFWNPMGVKLLNTAVLLLCSCWTYMCIYIYTHSITTYVYVRTYVHTVDTYVPPYVPISIHFIRIRILVSPCSCMLQAHDAICAFATRSGWITVRLGMFSSLRWREWQHDPGKTPHWMRQELVPSIRHQEPRASWIWPIGA